MAVSNRDRIGRIFELLGPALDEFHTYVLAKKLDGGDWTALLASRDKTKGAGASKTYVRTDPQNGLRMITEQIPNQIQKGWYPFTDHLSRTEQSWATELRDVRNTWAHNGSFTADDAYRALDTAERFLRAIGAPDQADEARRARIELMRLSSEKQDRKVVKTSAAAEIGADGLEPWRLVLSPHQDVQSGNFHAAEFAADLAMVSRSEGDPEYTDPGEFFARTYLTEGLKDLLVPAMQRLSGDPNAAPIINLQTNFGGGKTHSMLAVWHLASGRPLVDYPQEVQDLLAGTELPTARRVALVGTQIKAGAVKVMPDGTRINTIGGLLAWHLGGAEGYAMVAESDTNRLNPSGEALRELFLRFGPSVILIDEWVAYARLLFGHEELPDGTFDAQFTFAQALTEAAKAVPGTLVLISIPASAEMKDGEYVGDEEEVGGQNGREALKMLRKAVGRVAEQWRAANAEESFHIVRRRLFETPDSTALAKINATAKAMVAFYVKNSGDFPREVRELDYEERIRRSYPIHPELFDRLYQDWSTLERFQRTRGVLRLMNVIVGQLWRENDTAPLIMPGSIPLRADKVVTELTQYLDDQWKALIDTDVDGPNSAPAQVDNTNQLLGQRLTTQRLARTVFMGATPTLTSAHKGLDKQRIFLGTALPGDVPGNFHSALNHLANTATYFYNSGSLYWYDTQANTTRTARDHAERLHKEDVWAEVVRRLQDHRKTASDGFVGVHVAPDSSADVPDVPEVRLVIVPPAHLHNRKAKADSPAAIWAKDVTEHRGSAARTHRNMVTFLAADEARWGELDSAVRDFLAWSYIRDNADKDLNLTAAQRQQAIDRVATHDQAVADRLLQTYHWVLAPTQRDATKPLEIEAFKADGTTTDLAARAAAKLRNESLLTLQRSAGLIRHDLSGTLKAAWDRDGHISFGQLWDYYTTYPYLARLRDRTVLEHGVLSVFDEMIWQQTGFALAVDWDGQDYLGLVLPSDQVTPPQFTDAALLVQPARAEAQRERELADRPTGGSEAGAGGEDRPAGGGTSTTGTGTDGRTTTSTGGSDRTGEDTAPAKTRFFGSTALHPDFYGRDFNKITNEIIQHLAAADGVHLEVRIEITATTPRGFDENKIRTVSENATVLKFDQAGFEAE